jgi:hypothetical protein
VLPLPFPQTENENVEREAASEAEEAAVLRVQLQDLEETRTQPETRSAVRLSDPPPPDRIAEAARWADAAAGLLRRLAGAEVLESVPGAMRLRLRAAHPTGWVRGGDLGECSAATEHELTIELRPGAGVDGGPAVAAANLVPADVSITDVVAEAIKGRRGPDYVVRETQSRLAARLHRSALMKEAVAAVPGARINAGATMLTFSVLLPDGSAAEVDLSLARSWPAGDDEVRLAGVRGCLESKLGRAAAARLEGRSLVQAAEVLRRELLAP